MNTMTPRERLGLVAAPIVLRLVLALTFIWAGAGKIFPRVPFSPEQTAILANMGLDVGVAPRAKPAAPAPAPTSTPQLAPPSAPLPMPADRASSSAPSAPRRTAEAMPPDPLLVPAASARGPAPAAGARASPGDASSVGTGRYSAAHFPDGAELRRVYDLALLLNSRAEVRPHSAREVIKNPVPLWPASLGMGSGAFAMAWLAAISELAAGALLAVGLFTRLACLPIIVAMGTAIWLTQIGPAIWADNIALGFLPNQPWWDPAAWSILLWQVLLIGVGVAIMLLGPGPVSLDRAMFAPSRPTPAGG